MNAPVFRVQARTPEVTAAVAAGVARLLVSGDLLLLGGDLGAGKTTFTKGLAAALGVGEVVTSPTFTLLRSYRTTRGFELLHADVYRLERLQEIIDLGLAELLEDGAIGVIEWGERAAAALPGDYLDIHLRYGADRAPGEGAVDGAAVGGAGGAEAGAPSAASGSGATGIAAQQSAAPDAPGGTAPDADSSRLITFTAHGAGWISRLKELVGILEGVVGADAVMGGPAVRSRNDAVTGGASGPGRQR